MVAAYGVRSWPTTFVLGKDGKVAHVGSPYDAEAAVEAALGLEAGPAALLDAWLATLDGKAPDAQRVLRPQPKVARRYAPPEEAAGALLSPGATTTPARQRRIRSPREETRE